MSEMTGNLCASIGQNTLPRLPVEGETLRKLTFQVCSTRLLGPQLLQSLVGTVDCNHHFSGRNELLFSFLQLRHSWSTLTLVLHLSSVRNTQTTSLHLR